MVLENVVPSLFAYSVLEEHNYAVLRSPPEKEPMNDTQLVTNETQPESPSLPTLKTKVNTEKEAMNETQLVTSEILSQSPTLPTQKIKDTTIATRSVAPILPVQNIKFVVIPTLPTGVATLATTPLINKASIIDNKNTEIKNASKRGRPLPVYFGDFKEEDMLCPKKASKMFKVATETIRKQRALIRTLRTKSYRYLKRIKTLKEDLKHSESSNLELILNLKNENMLLHKRMHVLENKLDKVTLKGSKGVD